MMVLRYTLIKTLVSLKYLFALLTFLVLTYRWQRFTEDPASRPVCLDTESSRQAHYSINGPNMSRYEYKISKLGPNDYTTLIDLRNFTFNIINNVCDKSSVLLLVLVHSSSTGFERRQTIRETWGQRTEGMKLVFMIGEVNNETVQRMIEEEQKTHLDIAQGNFNDSYRNLTYKHVMCFKYSIYYCPQARYVLKTDDDIFINMPSMMIFLNPSGASNLILCNIYYDAPVLRTYRSKWRVSSSEYQLRKYPNYCHGWAVLYSPDVVFRLYREAQKSKYFWVDDAHITGILAKKINVTHTHTCRWILQRGEQENVFYGCRLDPERFYLYGGANLENIEIRKMQECDLSNGKHIFFQSI